MKIFHLSIPILGKKYLKNTFLKITPGKATAVIGTSGSCKSTFISLLLKMYLPNKGIIHFGSNSNNELSEKTIRKNIAVVSKDFPHYGKDVLALDGHIGELGGILTKNIDLFLGSFDQ